MLIKIKSLLDEFKILPKNYADAKAQSLRIDEILGLRCDQIESNLSAKLQAGLISKAINKEYWINLPIQAMQTPYSELREIVETLHPKSGETWVDLGAAYGRLGITLGLFYPNTFFIGYECIQERVHEGNLVFKQLGFENCSLKEQDLSDIQFAPQVADIYFIYDFGSREAVEKTLNDLKSTSTNKVITVIARGRGVQHWIQQGHPWLCDIIPPIRKPHYTIFKSG